MTTLDYLQNFIPTSEIGKTYFIYMSAISITLSIFTWRILNKFNIIQILLGGNKLFYEKLFLKLKLNKYIPLFTSLITIFIFLLISWQGYKILTNDMLLIKNWGPKNSEVSIVPNIQEDGKAALWIQTSMTYGLGELKVLINNKPVKETLVNRKLITASIESIHFDKAGKLYIVIEQISTGKKFIVGTLIIKKNGI